MEIHAKSAELKSADPPNTMFQALECHHEEVGLEISDSKRHKCLAARDGNIPLKLGNHRHGS